MASEKSSFNDTVRGAQTISFNETMYGRISSETDNRDFYHLGVDKDGKVKITLDPNSQLNVDLIVFKSATDAYYYDKNKAVQSKNSKGRNDEVSFDVKANDNLYIAVEKREGTGSYTLKCTLKAELSEELKLMIKTVYGEAAGCSSASWRAICNVIMNRVGSREWRRYKSVTDVIKNSGFDAYSNPNVPYRTAESYLENRDGSNSKIEELIEVVTGVYDRTLSDNTDGCQLYYSPEAQAALNRKYPNIYPKVPNWNFSVLKEVIVSGAQNDDLKFYKYK